MICVTINWSMRVRHCLCCVKGVFSWGEEEAVCKAMAYLLPPPPPPSEQSHNAVTNLSQCISPIFSQLFSPHLPMARAQCLLCRAQGEVVTKACGRWGMLKECDWCTVTYPSFRMYLMLIFLPGEIEELCLLGNPVLLSKCLWSTLSLWLRFILGLNCKHSFRQAITPNAKIWRLFTRRSNHGRLTGKTDYGM